jgi:DNA-directed RNA polymerase subunit RPC12/RpoP
MQSEREVLRAPVVSCPACGSRPALRVSQWVGETTKDEPPERRVASYKCQRRGCGAIYDITVQALRFGS